MTTQHLSAVNGDELLPGTDVGGYTIASKVGEGGMGVVYAAQQPSIGKRVAIKVLGPQYCRDKDMVARFEQEARLVNEIHHSNIVDIFQLGVLPDGRKYLVMELLEGESVSGRIERGRIPALEAIEILDAICDALQAVHEKNITHRDLKSDNVFLVSHRGQRRVKLLDFGLAKLSGNDPRAVTKTKTGFVVGTPEYMAPEQARGKQADGRTDIYALGILAYKMLTAELPFKGVNIELLVHHLKTPAPSPATLVPETPPALADAVQRMMAKEPEARPTLDELRSLFSDVRAGRRTIPVTSQGVPTGAQSAAIPAASHSQIAPAPTTSKKPAPWVYAVIAIGFIAVMAIAFAIVSSMK